MDESSGPKPLLPRHPAGWVALFGPGAIIASLTIGSGELVFSSRGGALFGYRLLGLFLMICLLKWALVFATARHLVLTGADPFQRWMSLPGPAVGCPAHLSCWPSFRFRCGSDSTPGRLVRCWHR